jgi:ankyrin repeat protein
LQDIFETHLVLRGLIRTVAYLIKGAIFRSDYFTDSLSRASLNICSLGELLDMYHAHEATKRHDKVYALLGMSSDDISKVGLLPDYKIPWEDLLQQLVKFLLCNEISVETWANEEIAVIKNKGCVLGKVTSVQSDMGQDNRQRVDVTFRNMPGQPGETGKWSARWTLQVSAKPIRNGDLICLLQGALKPTIVRSCEDHFAIIMIAATPHEVLRTNSGYIEWAALFRLQNIFTRDFLLVWDWENSLQNLQGQERYETLIRAGNPVYECLKNDLEGWVEKASKTWNIALILGDSEEYGKAEEKLREALIGFKHVFGEVDSYTLRGRYGQTLLVWAAGNGYHTVVNLLLAKDDTNPDIKDSQYGGTPLSWAARYGYDKVVKLLLETGKVDVESNDKDKRTPLSQAAKNGHDTVVKLLLETGKVDVDSKDKDERTPLFQAAGNGHEAVVKLLLETGKVDVESKDNDKRTPLSQAAKNGHDTVVKLLLETGKVDVDSKDKDERTPLSWAAWTGHKAVVKLLLETGQVNVDSMDKDEQTPQSRAAEKGHEAVVKLLGIDH